MSPLAAPLVALLSVAQAGVGPPRWMPESVAASVPAMLEPLRRLLGTVRALPLLQPPPGVFPRATLTTEPGPPGAPHRAILMLGFWPPQSVALRGGRLVSTSAIVHLMVYVNAVRAEAFAQDRWEDARGALFPEPKRLGDVQGFPVYAGFGGVEVSGILVVQPPGRSLFAPVSQERFHRFAIATLEKRLKEAQPALDRARQAWTEAVSPAGRARRDAAIASSLAQYGQRRPRTPEQMVAREAELRRMDAEEEARLAREATPDGNRLTGPLRASLAQRRDAFAALAPAERAQPAWTLPDSRDPGPHPVAAGTQGGSPVVCLARWADPSLPRTAWQLISVERYWMSAEEVRRGADRSPRNLPFHLNREVVEAIDWKAVARRHLR